MFHKNCMQLSLNAIEYFAGHWRQSILPLAILFEYQKAPLRGGPARRKNGLENLDWSGIFLILHLAQYQVIVATVSTFLMSWNMSRSNSSLLLSLSSPHALRVKPIPQNSRGSKWVDSSHRQTHCCTTPFQRLKMPQKIYTLPLQSSFFLASFPFSFTLR